MPWEVYRRGSGSATWDDVDTQELSPEGRGRLARTGAKERETGRGGDQRNIRGQDGWVLSARSKIPGIQFTCGEKPREYRVGGLAIRCICVF